MAQKTKTVLKGYFNNGDTPTQSNFEDLIDSLSSTLVAGTNINLTNNSNGTITVSATSSEPVPPTPTSEFVITKSATQFENNVQSINVGISLNKPFKVIFPFIPSLAGAENELNNKIILNKNAAILASNIAGSMNNCLYSVKFYKPETIEIGLNEDSWINVSSNIVFTITNILCSGSTESLIINLLSNDLTKSGKIIFNHDYPLG